MNIEGPVAGHTAEKAKERLREISHNQQSRARQSGMRLKAIPETEPPTPAPEQPQVECHLDGKGGLTSSSEDNSQSTVSGVVRGVETLGAWAGASLLANIRIQGIVDIEREAYL